MKKRCEVRLIYLLNRVALTVMLLIALVLLDAPVSIYPGVAPSGF